MAFYDFVNSYAGPGNWSIGGFKLPEFGITEKYGGNTQSIQDAANNSTFNEYVLKPALGDSTTYAKDSSGTYQPLSSSGFESGLTSGSAGSGGGGGGGGYNIVSEGEVDGAKVQTTDSGDILGLSDVKKTQGYLDWAAETGGTGQEYLEWLQDSQAREEAAINDAFNQGSNFLNEQEASLRGGLNDFINTFKAPFQAQIPLIQQALAQGQAGIENAKGVANQNAQNALDAARNLFNELSQRNQAAFGSGALSSTGQAAGELLGREGARQFGNIRQGATDAINSLVQKGIDLKSQADAQLQSLDIQMNQAVSEAQLAFREKLDEINSKRFELSQNKAAAKLAALQDFRNQVGAIKQQGMLFAQQLQAMKTQADLELRNALATTQQNTTNVLQDAQGTVANAANQFQQGQTQFGAANQIGGGNQVGFGTPLGPLYGNFNLGGDDEDRRNLLA